MPQAIYNIGFFLIEIDTIIAAHSLALIDVTLFYRTSKGVAINIIRRKGGSKRRLGLWVYSERWLHDERKSKCFLDRISGSLNFAASNARVKMVRIEDAKSELVTIETCAAV